MVVRYGRTVEPGFLPVYAVRNAKEARLLLTLACSTNLKGEFVARELVEQQTLENLHAFGNRLHMLYERMHKRHLPGCGKTARGCMPGCWNYDPKFDG